MASRGGAASGAEAHREPRGGKRSALPLQKHADERTARLEFTMRKPGEFVGENRGVRGRRVLLTVTSASEDQSDVDLRLQKVSAAEAEDMEGFGVGVACHFCKLPLTIVRGN